MRKPCQMHGFFLLIWNCMKPIYFKIPVYIIGLIFLFSCSNSTEHPSETLPDTASAKSSKTQDEAVNDTTKFKFDFAIANIPSPASVMLQLHEDRPLSNTFLLQAGVSDHCNSEFTRALAMGIYNIDFAYSIQTNQSQNVLNYMKAIAGMSIKLGLKNALDQILGQRVEQNLSQKDSLFSILDEVFYKSDAFLKTNKRMKVASLIFTGSWIEALYLNGLVGQQSTKPETLRYAKTLLWQQRFHLENLINLLNDFKSDATCGELSNDLSRILTSIKAEKQADQITDKRFAEFIQEIGNLRTRLFKL